MTRVTWDPVGGRRYEAGIDHAVLYLPTGAVAWNGVTSVDEDAPDDPTPLYFDGLKYADLPANDDLSATLRVFTYPDEFLPYDGVQSIAPGLFVDNQPLPTFDMSYRTRVGNDVNGTDAGYRIHLLYNLTAVSDVRTYESLSDQASALEFSWKITGVPEAIVGYRPTAHAIIDSTRVNKYYLQYVEGLLYGTSTTAPTLPSLDSLVQGAINYQIITITDNGDGTWTATGPDELVYIDPTLSTAFVIEQANATVGGSAPYASDTFTISNLSP